MSPTTHPVRSRKEDRERALVQAAFNQIAERGFEGLRTREVAAGVGLNIATLHYYFPTKEALIRGVLAHAMDRFRSTLAPHGSPADQLRNHLRAVRKLLRDEPEVGAVMGELALRSARDPALARIMGEAFKAWHSTLRGLLDRATRDGYLASDLSPQHDPPQHRLGRPHRPGLPPTGTVARAGRAENTQERVKQLIDERAMLVSIT